MTKHTRVTANMRLTGNQSGCQNHENRISQTMFNTGVRHRTRCLCPGLEVSTCIRHRQTVSYKYNCDTYTADQRNTSQTPFHNLHYSRSHYLPQYLVLFLTIISLFVIGCHGDLCLDTGSSEALQTNLHSKSTPKGGVYAGKYTKDLTSTTLENCFLKCCSVPTCNVVFYHHDTCFLIECNKTVPDACDAQHRTDAKFTNTVMINVRSLVETSAPGISSSTKQPQSSLSPDYSDENSIFDGIGDLDVENECDPEKHHDCGVGGTCRLVVTKSILGYVCECTQGYIKDSKTNLCISSTSSRSSDRSCIFGLLSQCEMHEECIPNNSRSRSGHCLCVDGYKVDSVTGWCKLAAETTTESPQTTAAETVKAEIRAEESKITDQSLANTSPATVQPSITVPQKNVERLVVSAGENKVVQLPNNQISLTAYTVPQDTGLHYTYEWKLLSHPNQEQMGQMQDSNTATLKLSKLVQGLYTFKVSVSGNNKYGEASVNLTVLPPARDNAAPVVIVKPPSQEVHLPNNVVIDGSESTDDDKIVKFHWEKTSGPLNSKSLDDTSTDQAMLIVKDLVAGKYSFKLTVTDSDGVENSTIANVTVIKETDYPPKANAGSNVILNLPQNSVTLFGNSSTDDKGIVSYEWVKKTDGTDNALTADMTGVRTAFLELKNLQVGDYTFTLKVTDTAGQQSSADVHVFVRQEINKPPVSVAGTDKVIFLPTMTTTLDGTNSSDDTSIVTYQWTQAKGPATAAIENADRAVATASKLQLGEYKFKLTVYDIEGLSSDSYVTITVKENENHPPKANAGGDKMLNLPLDLITLDGTKSVDDRSILSYHWVRDDKSLAAGRILNSSDKSAVLQMTDIVAGRYIFTLTVEDEEGLSSSDTASIVVKPDPNLHNLVELVIGTDLAGFTELQRKNLANQLGLLLHQRQGDVTPEIVIQDLQEQQGHLKVVFFARMKSGKAEVMNGTDVIAILKTKLKSDAGIMDFKVLNVQTVVCQNKCSGHGHCSSPSSTCVCEAFWMHNYIRVFLGDGESNCDWSILYVIIIAFIAVVALAGGVWAIICLCKRWYRWRPKKRHRYTLLEELDGDKEDKSEMLPRSKMQNSSLMVSESDFSSDEETLFVNHRKTNGHLKNGMVKNRSKVKT